jgi:CubicO group peptidase (beta-lactamase class C family)
MIARRSILLSLGATVACLAPSSSLSQQPPVIGTWTGVLEVGMLRTRLRLQFEIAAGGAVVVRSLDQGGASATGTLTSEASDRLEIDVPQFRGRFSGKRVSADRIEGTWTQAAPTPLILQRGNEAPAAPPAAEPLTQARLEALRQQGDLPALAAAAARKGAQAKRWVTGERALGRGVAASLDDLWHLGSITKSMTATLVAKLAEAGAVRWDDTVGAVLKSAAPDMLDAYNSVTLRHLCSHRAGLAASIPSPEFAKFPRESADAREDRRAWTRIVLAQQPIGPKETTFLYSNSGYILAGAMLETKLGETWEALIRKHVFEPLNLGSAGFGAPGEKGKLTQPAGHYSSADGATFQALRVGEQPTDNPAVLGPAGRVHMSLNDVLAYLAAHRDHAALLKTESWRLLHTPPFDGTYAMGWAVRTDGALAHNGSNTLWSAEVMFDRASGISGIAVTNEARPRAATLVSQTLACAEAAV